MNDDPDTALHRRWHAVLAVALLVMAGALMAAWWRSHGASTGTAVSAGDKSSPAAPAAPATRAAQAESSRALDLADRRAFDDASRGFVARPKGRVLAADGSTVWDFERFAFVDGEAPATVHPSLWRHARLNNQIGLFTVAPGIHQLRGFDLANITLIEGRSGWIVVDTLTTRETAAAAMAFARQHLGDKPVSALIFTHSHADHFGGALGVVTAEQVAQRKIPVVAPAGFLDEATSENVLVGPAMGRRATYQFGNLLPASVQGLVDAGLGKGLALGHIDVLAPTVTIDRTPQEMTLDGVRFVFQNVPGSEAPAELAFYLPDLKAYCGAEMLSQTMHNLYTLRGAKVRDALRWSDYIDDAIQRFPEAEVFFASHHWPVWGRAAVQGFMARQRDVYRYTHDQTVRLLNAGMKPHEIAETLKLPASLEADFAVRGYYGTLRHNAKAVYQHYLGWFDGNPANLDPLPRREAAARYVALMGGAHKTVAAGQAAFDRGEFRWAAELLNHLVFAEPGHAAARELLARCYEQLGYAAESAIWRSFYLSGALELRSGKTGTGPEAAMAAGVLAQAPVERYFEAMAAAINGPKADGLTLKIDIVFPDTGSTHRLWLENAVLHHRRAEPTTTTAATAATDADATLTLPQARFVQLMLGTASPKDVLLDDAVKLGGSRVDLLRFFALIEKPPRGFAIVAP